MPVGDLDLPAGWVLDVPRGAVRTFDCAAIEHLDILALDGCQPFCTILDPESDVGEGLDVSLAELMAVEVGAVGLLIQAEQRFTGFDDGPGLTLDLAAFDRLEAEHAAIPVN